MAEENKKGGFWSWLGLGKKKESETPQQEPSVLEKVEQNIEEIKEKVEDAVEKAEDTFEQISDQIEDKIEQLGDKIEDRFDQITENFSEELVETVENFVRSEQHIVADEESSTLEPVNTEQLLADMQTEQPLEAQDEKSAVDFAPVLEEQTQQDADQIISETQTQEKPSEGGFFSRLVKGLLKTKQNIGAGFRSLFSGKKIDDDLFEELEEQLLVADIGMPTTSKIINNLTEHATRQQLKDADLLYQQLKIEMADILKPVERPLVIDSAKKPYVILMVGVNGVGKTTTIGKLARQFQNQGKSVMLAAGDTFRAAAVEQLQVWGERNHIPVIAQSTGSDSASVIFDAMQSAAARNIDILIADTAGRLQNKNNLMDELKKIVRVMKKYDESAPHEIMLTLDAGTGQNAISQAKLFNEAVGLTGISLTKLDGTAKGGVIFAIADQFNLPIRYIGVGEKIEDLRTFNAQEFIDALFAQEE